MLSVLLFACGSTAQTPPAGTCYFDNNGTPGIVVGRFCGILTDPHAGAGTGYHPHLNVVINCPHVPSSPTDLPASLYGVCDIAPPDYCDNEVLCLGTLASLSGVTATFSSSVELSKGSNTCFSRGSAVFQLRGNSSGLDISGIQIPMSLCLTCLC